MWETTLNKEDIMKSKKLFFLLLITSILNFGCDRVRSFFGMATSQDLEEVRVEQQREARAKQIADSIEKSAKDSLLLTEEEPKESSPTIPSNKRVEGIFHIIVGSFKEPVNASKMVEKLKEMGYTPTLFHFKNGYNGVSLISFSEIDAAYNHIAIIKSQDQFVSSSWIYDIKQNLHN